MTVPLTPASKRQRVQDALDRYIAGQASDSDLAVFRDRGLMYTATAEQACRFIEAATGAGRPVPSDLLLIWANILRHRYLVGRHSRLLREQKLALAQLKQEQPP
jgi:hypothetical protein